MIGKTISHYKILEKIGEGGMGEVYLAEDTKLKRKVALKFLPREYTKDQDAKERFQREAQAAAALNHPNIVTIHEINEHEDQTYIAMEYVEGKTLKEIISGVGAGLASARNITSNPLPMADTLKITTHICEGLKKAHEAGIVHRDIKPQNIIINQDGQVKILDFGLAKLKGVSQLTKESSTLGTVHYMSPEQALGKEVNHRTDIWSLGVVLYEMITGHLPFKGDYEQAVIYSILNEKPEPVTGLNSGVPMDMEQIITKLLSKKPSERYQHVDDLMVDLKDVNERSKKDITETKREIVSDKKLRIKKFILPIIFLLTMIVVIGGYFIFKEKKEEPVTQIISKTEKKIGSKWKNSIAVLPFVDMSPDKDQEYFCDGMADEIINALTHIPDLRVVARTSAFSFKGKNMDIREIGKKLNVGVILEGSVRKSGDNLRITAQLINVKDGYHIWSEKYERKLADIFTLQDKISLAIVEKLKIKILGIEKKRLTKHHTDNIQAYNMYLRGRYFLNKRNKADLEQAIEHFKKSLEIDPLYALAYSGLADCYTTLAIYGFAPPRSNFKNAKKMATKALEIDDMIAEAHASLGWVTLVSEWDWDNARREFIRAIDINPGYATAHHWYTYSFLIKARFNQALERIYHAQELDPLSPVISRVVSEVLFYKKDYDESIQAAQATLEMESNMPYAHMLIGTNYLHKGLYQKALIEFEKEKDIWSNQDGIDLLIGITYAKIGRRKDAEYIKERLKRDDKNCYRIAQLCFVLGEDKEGFEWLEKSYEKRVWWLLYAKINASFEIVRSDPRFQDILKRMKLDK